MICSPDFDLILSCSPRRLKRHPLYYPFVLQQEQQDKESNHNLFFKIYVQSNYEKDLFFFPAGGGQITNTQFPVSLTRWHFPNSL